MNAVDTLEYANATSLRHGVLRTLSCIPRKVLSGGLMFGEDLACWDSSILNIQWKRPDISLKPESLVQPSTPLRRLRQFDSMCGIRSDHASFSHVGKINHLFFYLILYRVLPLCIFASLSSTFVVDAPSCSILDTGLVIIVISKQEAFALHASLLIR